MKDAVYLSNAELKGYKSILNTKVSFKPGLNIIIGRNGSGKTNFVDLLDCLLNFESKRLFDLNANLTLTKENENVILSFNNNSNLEAEQDTPNGISTSERGDSEFINKNHTTSSYNFGEKVVEQPPSMSNLLTINFQFLETIIEYSLPQNLNILSDSFDLTEKLPNGHVGSKKLQKLIYLPGENNLTKTFFIILQNIPVNHKWDGKITQLEELICKLKNYVKDLTGVKDIRLSQNLRIESSDESFSIRSLYLEYFVNGDWFKFSDLSDGTRRLIFIVSEVLSFKNFGWGYGLYYSRPIPPSKIIFIEEPELGIHPHQLHLLMNFIKEEAENKQIIITTHSPQVLNVLSKDELDRILICEWTPKEGTQLRNMTEKEMQDAHVYMDEVGNLSDYWLHSDFNRI